jgi:hypothetical protein
VWWFRGEDTKFGVCVTDFFPLSPFLNDLTCECVNGYCFYEA